MDKEVSILGCGWLGKNLAYHLKKRNYIVKGANTTTKNSIEFQERNIPHYVINLNHQELNFSDFLSSKILIISITLKNIALFKRFVKEIEQSSIEKVIFISSTSVYQNTNGIVSENSLVNASFLAQIENIFKPNSFFKTTIIRFGGLYGYNRNPVNFISKTRKMLNPNGYVNLIHRDDCIAIIEKIIENGLWNELFNACCGSHPKRKTFYINLAKKYDKKLPEFETDREESFKIISSEKLVKRLNYNFKHNDLMKMPEATQN